MKTKPFNSSDYLSDGPTYIAYLQEAIKDMNRPLSMQDIRLVAGDGKLAAHDVLSAVNVILSQRLRVYRVAD